MKKDDERMVISLVTLFIDPWVVKLVVGWQFGLEFGYWQIFWVWFLTFGSIERLLYKILRELK